MKNTLSITPLIGDESQATYMTGHLETAHGWYGVKMSNKDAGSVMVVLDSLYKRNTIYIKSFESIGEAMNAMLTMKFDDERFMKIG